MRRTSAAAAVALLLLLAGCSALPFGGGGLTAAQAPPGVAAENGTLTNASALTTAHTEETLASGVTYEFVTNATVVQRGEARRVGRRQVTRVAPNRTQYAYTTSNPGSAFDVWGNRTVQAVRFRLPDRTLYRQSQPISDAALTGQSVFERYLSVGGWNVTNVTERDDGPTLVTLRSTSRPADAQALPGNATDLRDYEARIVVDSQGRIHAFETHGSYTIDGTEGSYRLSYELRSIGAPGISRPEWVTRALS